MPPAIIGGAIAAAGAIGGALIKSKAAKSAAKTQAEGVTAAKAEIKPLYQQTQANYQPYYNTGTQANQTLGAAMGFNQQQPAQMSQPTSAVSRTGASGSVRMRAPDGSVQSVPSNMVQHYQSRGAQLF